MWLYTVHIYRCEGTDLQPVDNKQRLCKHSHCMKNLPGGMVKYIRGTSLTWEIVPINKLICAKQWLYNNIKRKKSLTPLWELNSWLFKKNLSSRHTKTHCAKFGWNWVQWFWRRQFLILFTQECLAPNLVEIHPVDYLNFFNVFLLFRYYLPLKKKAGPFIWTNISIYFTQGCFVPSLVEIGPVVKEKIFNFRQYIFTLVIFSPLKKAWSFILESWGCFVRILVEIGQVVLEKKRIWRIYNNDYNNHVWQRTNYDQKSSLEPSA